eukprot:m.603659 g.603659  ORF g.603659 m.603659 type:complete len:380 (-) comp22456_c0_seq1:607-1746(-)
MLHALIAHVARDSVAPISYASYLFSTVLSRKPSSDCAYGSHTHLLVLTSCVGMPLMQVHWTSHLVHLTHLFDGSVQREQFSRLAQHNFFGLQVVPFGVMHKVASYNDVKVRLQDDSWSPAAIVIEIPQRMNGGATITFDDLRQLRSVCTRKGIHMHMDGARLWEAQPHYGRSISDICALFDSVYVSFYKGLGAMAGAMLCGSEAFVDAAREWRHRLGGQPFTFSPAWIDCKHRFELHKDSFQKRFDHLCGVVEALKSENIVYPKGLIRFIPEVPQSCMVHVYIGVPAELAVEAHRRAQRVPNQCVHYERVIFPYQCVCASSSVFLCMQSCRLLPYLSKVGVEDFATPLGRNTVCILYHKRALWCSAQMNVFIQHEVVSF